MLKALLLISVVLSLTGCNLHTTLVDPPDGNEMENTPDMGVEDLVEETDSPADVEDMPIERNEEEWEQIFAGYTHSCALTVSGDAWCWGAGTDRELGRGLFDSAIPLRVDTSEKFRKLALGRAFSCGITLEDRLYCWGTIPGGLEKMSPFQIEEGVWQDIKSAVDHVCATQEGILYCWGSNSHGQLGTGERSSAVDLPLKTDHEVDDFATSDGQTCAILSSDGSLFCWGYDLHRTPSTSTLSSAYEHAIESEESFVSIEGGRTHFCAMTSAGVPHCFGRASYLSQFRREGPNGEPRGFVDSRSFQSIAIGSETGCGIDDGGRLWCWGGNRRGRAGRGTESSSDTSPVNLGQVLSDEVFRSVAVGNGHACAITESSEVHCWGEHWRGATGHTLGYSTSPVKVDSPLAFKDIAVGSRVTCGMEASGSTYCWGQGSSFALGLGSPDHVATPARVTSVSARHLRGSASQFCVSEGTEAQPSGMKCWGSNTYGMLGNGNTTTQTSPVSVSMLGNLSDFAVGDNNTCAWDANAASKSQFCWGRSTARGTDEGTGHVPVALNNHPWYSKIAIGTTHACGIVLASSRETRRFEVEDMTATTGELGPDGFWVLGENGSLSQMVDFGVTGEYVIRVRAYQTQAGEDDATLAIRVGGIQRNYAIRTGADDPYLYESVVDLTAGTHEVRVEFTNEHISFLPPATRQLHIDWVEVVGTDALPGSLACWGSNSVGQLGNETTTSSLGWQPVKSDLAFLDVAANNTSSCAVSVEGELYCWGSSRATGRSSTANRTTPGPVAMNSLVKSVAGQGTSFCAIDENNELFCWGGSSYGQAGGSHPEYRVATPQKIDLPAGVEKVVSGETHTCALLTNSETYCWGEAVLYALGDGSFGMSVSPTPIND